VENTLKISSGPLLLSALDEVYNKYENVVWEWQRWNVIATVLVVFTIRSLLRNQISNYLMMFLMMLVDSTDKWNIILKFCVFNVKW
jgi:hypothetical protein